MEKKPVDLNAFAEDVAEIASSLANVFADGRVKGLKEFVTLAKAPKEIGDLVSSFPGVKESWNSLSKVQRHNAFLIFEEKLDFENDNSEILFERGVGLAIAAADFIEQLKKFAEGKRKKKKK